VPINPPEAVFPDNRIVWVSSLNDPVGKELTDSGATMYGGEALLKTTDGCSGRTWKMAEQQSLVHVPIRVSSNFNVVCERFRPRK
jgi:hypothetical protein